MIDFVAFDVFILRRKGAEESYEADLIKKTQQRFESMNREQRYELDRTIIAGLPGAEESYSLEQFQQKLDEYKNIDDKTYRKNLKYFLEKSGSGC